MQKPIKIEQLVHISIIRNLLDSSTCQLPLSNSLARSLMETDRPSAYRYMGRSFTDPGDVFSDGSGEFSSSASSSTVSLHNLLISNTANYSDETVHRLITDLQSPTIETRRRAAMELRLLAKHSPENRLRIARAGAVHPLVSLISHPDLQLQESAITAILNLALLDENKDAIAAAGAIKPLVYALETGTFPARENAACALLRLTQSEEHRSIIGRSGAIPPLVMLLESGGLRGKKDAATALYALCSSSRENRRRAVDAGAVRVLLDLMADPESGMVDKAAYVLSTIVGVAEGRAATVSECGIPVLVEVLEVGTRRQKEIAAAVLLKICEDSANYRAMAVHEGAVPALMEIPRSGTSRAKQKAEALIELLQQRATHNM